MNPWSLLPPDIKFGPPKILLVPKYARRWFVPPFLILISSRCPPIPKNYVKCHLVFTIPIQLYRTEQLVPGCENWASIIRQCNTYDTSYLEISNSRLNSDKLHTLFTSFFYRASYKSVRAARGRTTPASAPRSSSVGSTKTRGFLLPSWLAVRSHPS